MMIRKAATIAMTVLLAAVTCSLALGQAPPPTILEIDAENIVEYQNDITVLSDPSKIATNPNVTPAVPPRNFLWAVLIGDIVAVNGQPAKGTFVARTHAVTATPAPNPGDAIADISTLAIRYQTFQILQSNGAPVGTIMAFGLEQGGNPPPGAPLAQTGQNFAIVGGTGAFLGARGQQGQERTPQTVNARMASAAEDPARRRINGGGMIRFILHVIPMTTPQILTTASGPAVVHSSDFSLVTAAKPAAAGEILSLFATGLGPTRPGVDPGQPFPSNPPAAVNSPVEVRINGKPAEVLAAVGFPGALDGYQVNFRMPPDAPKGATTVQVSAAWIGGAPVSIAVQ